MTEYELIQSLARGFRRHPDQLNDTFTCDAELVPIGGQTWALTVDDFSPEEDLFSSDDPEALGANLAVATLSDLLACGADPQLFLPAICLPREVDEAFTDGLTRGVAAVLDEVGCYLCGGDVGTAETWRFCGVAMGPVPSSRPLTRVLPREPQTIWVTGELGDANLAAFLGAPTPRFELRWDVARLIRQVGTACIDTSGGLLDAAWLLAMVSPGVRLELDLARVPLPRGLVELSRTQGVPAEAGLVGGAGEYELLFSTPADLPDHVCAQLARLDAVPVGSAVPATSGGLFVGEGGGARRHLRSPPPCPRAAAGVDDHVREAIAYAIAMLDASGPTPPQPCITGSATEGE